jgi:hypothetical protein
MPKAQIHPDKLAPGGTATQVAQTPVMSQHFVARCHGDPARSGYSGELLRFSVWFNF